MLYQHAAGGALASTTFFGDFGIDLARSIAHSPILSANLNTEQPENKGRATVYGLTLHSTEVSGHTIFLPKPDCLPLSDLPIIAKLSLHSLNDQWQRAFTFAAKRELGACIQIKRVDALNHDKLLDETRALAQKIKAHCLANQMTNTQPLLILTEANIGKTLGNYISDWGQYMQYNVTSFIGPETHLDNYEMIYSCLQDHFMGKLMGLAMGMAPCYTLHSQVTIEGQKMATELLTAAGANFFMDVYLGTDRMLAYFDTGGHDDQTLRETYNLRPAPEFLAWAISRGIFIEDADGNV